MKYNWADARTGGAIDAIFARVRTSFDVRALTVDPIPYDNLPVNTFAARVGIVAEIIRQLTVWILIQSSRLKIIEQKPPNSKGDLFAFEETILKVPPSAITYA